MPIVVLPDRTIVSVAGPDAEHLLQNIITTDLDALKPGEAKPGALLTAQGKILFDFLVSRDGADGFRFDVRADIADDFVRRLQLYRLRARAEIAKQEQVVVAAEWENDSGASQTDSSASHPDSTRVVDTRFRLREVWRVYGVELPPPLTPPLRGEGYSGTNAPVDQEASMSPPPSPLRGGVGGGGNHTALETYTRLRILNAVAESGVDYALSDAFPHDVLLDQNDGVGFGKGCFVGQEVVSRMKHRGTARRRVLIAKGKSALPSPGAELRVGGRTIGALGSVDGADAIAIVRIDKVKQALDADEPILAGDVPVSLAIPAWASFTFPADAAEEA